MTQQVASNSFRTEWENSVVFMASCSFFLVFHFWEVINEGINQTDDQKKGHQNFTPRLEPEPMIN